MSILQFLRIFWVRRWLLLLTTAASLVGAVIVMLIVPPSWDARARIMLNFFKPDPVTGDVIASGAMGRYVLTQAELVRDYTVASGVADQLGWTSDPGLIEQYRKSGAVTDFRHWLAERIIAGTKARLLQDSNILEISYSGASPDQARAVANALSKAYIDRTLSFRREDATRNADWYQTQVDKAKAALDQADEARSKYERENGLILSGDNIDLETARLAALSQTAPVAPAAAAQGPSATALQLAQVDGQISQLSQTLGPNHPELKQLKAQRAALAQQVAAERAAAARASKGESIDEAVRLQKSRVLANSDKIARLKQLQSIVDLRRDEYNKAQSREAQFRQEAASVDSGLTELGGAVTSQKPTFPNVPLILAGALIGGLGVGALLALLIELLYRRVRSPADLQRDPELPLLAILPVPAQAGADRRRSPITPWPAGRRKLAQT